MPRFILTSILTALAVSGNLRAQDPGRGSENLHFTEQSLMPRCHVTARVELDGEHQTRFQYERFPADSEGPAHERLTFGDSVFQRTGKSVWTPLDAPGKTNAPATEAASAQLDAFVAAVNAPFISPEFYDSKLGSLTWRMIAQEPPENSRPFTAYIYERSREHPAPGASYPRFTFMKTLRDKDGELPLMKAHGHLRLGPERVAYTVEYHYELVK